MNKHLKLLIKLLIYNWNYNVGYNDWNNKNKSRKQHIIEVNIYKHLKNK